MDKDTLRSVSRIAIVLTLLGVGVAGYRFYDFSEQEVVQLTQKNQALESKLKAKQVEMERLKNFALNIEAIKIELRELNLQLETAMEYMPRNFNLSALLRQFTTLAQNSGVEMGGFQPEKEKREKNQFYSSIGVRFDLAGTFAQTMVFLDQLARLKRIVNVELLDVKVKSDLEAGAFVTQTNTLVRAYRFAD